MEYVGDAEGLTRLSVEREWVEQRLHERTVARRAREFEWADQILRDLTVEGIIVMDRTVGLHGTSEGVEWVVRKGDQHRGLVNVGPGARKQ